MRRSERTLRNVAPFRKNGSCSSQTGAPPFAEMRLRDAGSASSQADRLPYWLPYWSSEIFDQFGYERARWADIWNGTELSVTNNKMNRRRPPLWLYLRNKSYVHIYMSSLLIRKKEIWDLSLLFNNTSVVFFGFWPPIKTNNKNIPLFLHSCRVRVQKNSTALFLSLFIIIPIKLIYSNRKDIKIIETIL